MLNPLKNGFFRTIISAGNIHFLLVFFLSSQARGEGWSGEIRTEYRYFRDEAAMEASAQAGLTQVLIPQQVTALNNFLATQQPRKKTDPTVVIEGSYRTRLSEDSDLSLKIFIRYDGMDHYRTHHDLRELVWHGRIHQEGGPLDLRIGIDKVYWGVAESNHLVDVINQTDAIEDMDRSEKLGQSMARFSMGREWGTAELFILPYFREPTWAGPDGRLRPPQALTDVPVQYESAAKQYHTDIALRWSNSYGDGDLGIYYFKGTNRAPRSTQSATDITDRNPLGLILNYEQMRQVGLDATYLAGDWTFKTELIYRYTQFEDYRAAVYGGEYPFTGLLGSAWDLNLFLERSYDSRGSNSAAELQNDVFAGAHVSLNDSQSTQVRFGVMQDLSDASRTLRLEASRRIADGLVLKFEGQYFQNIAPENPLYVIQADSYMQLSVQYFF